MTVITLYRLKQHDRTVKIGTLSQVWNYTKNLVGNISGQQFKDDGYVIESNRRKS